MKPGVYSWCELHQVKAGLTMRLLKCGIYHVLRSSVAVLHLQYSDIKTVQYCAKVREKDLKLLTAVENMSVKREVKEKKFLV